MRNNETILQLIGDTESFVKQRLVEVVQADASPDTIREFVNCLSSLECAVNNMGRQRFDAPIPSSGFGDSNAIYAIAREAVAPIEKSLMQLTERIEKSLAGGGSNYQPGDAHFDEEYR